MQPTLLTSEYLLVFLHINQVLTHPQTNSQPKEVPHKVDCTISFRPVPGDEVAGDGDHAGAGAGAGTGAGASLCECVPYYMCNGNMTSDTEVGSLTSVGLVSSPPYKSCPCTRATSDPKPNNSGVCPNYLDVCCMQQPIVLSDESPINQPSWNNSSPEYYPPWNNNIPGNSPPWNNNIPGNSPPWNNNIPGNSPPWNNNIPGNSPPWNNNIPGNSPPWNNNIPGNSPPWNNNIPGNSLPNDFGGNNPFWNNNGNPMSGNSNPAGNNQTWSNNSPGRPNSRPQTPADNPTWVDEHPRCGRYFTNRLMFDDQESLIQFDSIPWMVAIFGDKIVNGVVERNSFLCGGSLINPIVVLTAAHCIKGKPRLMVKVGTWYSKREDQLQSLVHHVQVHEEFYAGALFNDVALLFLETSFQIGTNIGTVCLPEPHLRVNLDDCFASGWGNQEFGVNDNHGTVLKKVALSIVPRAFCEDKLRTTRLGRHFHLHEGFICAKGEMGQDTCAGDGGGPLVCRTMDRSDCYVQVGIVSWGIGCGEEIPGVYVNISHYLPWIKTLISNVHQGSMS